MTQSDSINFCLRTTNLLVKMENPIPLIASTSLLPAQRQFWAILSSCQKSDKSSDQSQVMAGVEKGLEQFPLFCSSLSLSVETLFLINGSQIKNLYAADI